MYIPYLDCSNMSTITYMPIFCKYNKLCNIKQVYYQNYINYIIII